MVKDMIFAASKAVPCDLVVEDIQIVDVFTQDIYRSDVAVHAGFFVGIGDYKGCGNKVIDGRDCFMAPGLIDAHAHIESTLVTPAEYSNASLIHGITAVIADPHEIANVAGVKGIEFMIESARKVPMDIYFMLPSCVPATAFENAGAVLKARDLVPLYQHPEVRGLGEVMDLSAVQGADPDMMEKIRDARARGLMADGHCAGFNLDQLNLYAAAGIRTDHECDTAEGLMDRARRGIYTLVRQGTVCKDLLKLLPAINAKTARMLCFSTDDKHLDELLEEGGVNVNIKLAVANGLDPATAVQMATLNPARCYGLTGCGAVAPGYAADFAILSSLEKFEVAQVFKDGQPVAGAGKISHRVAPDAAQPDPGLLASVQIPEVHTGDLAIAMGGAHQANVIKVEAGSVVTRHLVEAVDVENDRFRINTEKDQLKIAVVERHRRLGSMGVGVIKGLKLETGAIATTIAHDSHNLIAVGSSDAEIIAAINALSAMQGGIVVVEQQKIQAALKLEIAGLITARPALEVAVDLKTLNEAVLKIAPACSFNVFLALSFMSLVVIPHLKISDKGLFRFDTFSFDKVPVGPDHSDHQV